MRLMKIASGLVATARICKPCDADWNAMVGDDRVRFCGTCKKDVHDLAAITPEEGEHLLRGNAGRICIILAATVAMAAGCTKGDPSAPASASTDARAPDASAAAAPSIRRPGCYCQPGDALCSCL